MGSNSGSCSQTRAHHLYTHNYTMDMDRVMMMSTDTHGSLLNRVYELQCMREKEELTATIKDRTDMEKLSLALNNMCQLEEKKETSCEKYSQARARADPVYILQQQQIQLQLQQQQQQQLIAYSSLVTHQQFCQPQQL